MYHSEALALAEEIPEPPTEGDALVLLGAHVYLNVAGARPRTELIRVLAQHLEVSLGAAGAAIDRLIDSGLLQLTESTVSLPAGDAIRDTKRN